MDTSTPTSSLALPSSTLLSSPLPASITSSPVASLPTVLSLSFPSISLPSFSLPSFSLPSFPSPSPSDTSLSASSVPTTSNTALGSDSAINVPFLVGCIVGSIGGLSLSVGGLLLFLYRRQRRNDRREKEESQRHLDLPASCPSPDAEIPEDKTVGVAVLSAQHSTPVDLRDQETYTDAGRLPPGRRGAVSQPSSEVFGIFRNGTPEV
ncbi:hypothetical protein PHLGIDRAFT_385333 [Phlebiopsis gigantea 11061_1 CR5-6]|uniref:Uncharacterized protein n=1 Tax=Phlebiopsis gigantea (strain 11061_1 CR5-6) TaxID=745531 RepID=A0A0C3PNB9_PHLG1|nr:hypothetical protein PHLGIDRAFT_385333 [Phlebiopsis gigantea 11061_1 CR5-6]